MLKKLFNKIFKEQTDNTFFQLIRYTFVGGVAFLADFGTLAFLTEIFNINYLISAAIAFCIGVTINYFLSIVWVFSKSTYDNKAIEFSFVLIISLVGLGFNELFIWFLTAKISLYYLLSKIISAAIVYLWNFFARKYLLFNKK